jgi:replication-associated recombination protein RarA
MFCDFYSPKQFSDFVTNLDSCDRIKSIIDNSDYVPNIILFGPEGCGKQSMAWCIMEYLYSEFYPRWMDDISVVSDKIKDGRGNRCNISVTYGTWVGIWEPLLNAHPDDSLHAISINKVVGLMSKSKPTKSFRKVPEKINHKTTLLIGLDQISQTNQSVLRKYMECDDGLRFIVTCKSLDRIDAAIVSRSICIRLTYPSEEELDKIGDQVLIDHPSMFPTNMTIYEIVSEFLQTRTNHSPYDFLHFLESYNYKNSHWTTRIDDVLRISLLGEPIQKDNIRREMHALLRKGLPIKDIFECMIDRIWDMDIIEWEKIRDFANNLIKLLTSEQYPVEEDLIYLEMWLNEL